MSSLTAKQKADLKRRLTPRLNKYIAHTPTVKQSAFLLLDCIEAFYGGSAGPGKSDGLLMAALQYFDWPGYNALLLRRTFADLSLPEALMDRASDWLGPTAAKWDNMAHAWRSPEGGTLTFGYLEVEKHKYRYQSAAFQFIGLDELTQFSETQYRYMFSRLRRLKGVDIPLRMRAASNPGNVGHMWVKQRFITEGAAHGRVFVKARLIDNPHLDRSSYIQSLNQLDPITRQQLLEGDWEARHEGGMFKREWLPIIEMVPAGGRWVRYWDLAATPASVGADPDWTVGLLMGVIEGVYYVADVIRIRATPGDVERVIKQTAQIDSKSVDICMEQEPGSAGKIVIDHYTRTVLPGYTFRGDRVGISKPERAAPFSSMCEGGNVRLKEAAWNGELIDELELFPQGSKKDQADAAGGAFNQLTSDNGPPSGLRAATGLSKASYWRMGS